VGDQVSSLRVEPEVLVGLAGRFHDIASQFESLIVDGFDLGGTGDPQLSHAIEEFLERSRGGVVELLGQFGEVHQVLMATAQGYGGVESHLEAEITQNLEL
jgi:hypothetical protein